MGDGVPFVQGPAKLVEKLAGYTAREPVIVCTDCAITESRGLHQSFLFLVPFLHMVLQVSLSYCFSGFQAEGFHFLKYVITDALNYGSTPDPLGLSR